MKRQTEAYGHKSLKRKLEFKKGILRKGTSRMSQKEDKRGDFTKAERKKRKVATEASSRKGYI